MLETVRFNGLDNHNENSVTIHKHTEKRGNWSSVPHEPEGLPLKGNSDLACTDI
jgi:hypothetical protein